ncbi:MAG: ribonuclease E/G [Robiginitomaculum sp.]
MSAKTMLIKFCHIEEAIGETRAAVLYKNRPIEYYVRRWSERSKPRAGDVFSGRVTSIDKTLMAAFVELGAGPQGLFSFTQNNKAPRITEGQMLRVQILRESEAGKGPLLGFVELSGEKKPTKEKCKTLKEMIRGRYKDIKFINKPVDDLERATETEVSLMGGGFFYIEHTRAGTMIDVDTGGAGSKTEIGMRAAQKIAHQVRLRGIGGLVLVDFPNVRKHKDREMIWKTLNESFIGDPDNVKIAPFSRFGTVEFTRTRRGSILAHVLNDKFGRETAETIALQGLRRLDIEAQVQGGAKLKLELPKRAYEWLENGVIDWKMPLTAKFGARFSVKIGPKIDVYKE